MNKYAKYNPNKPAKQNESNLYKYNQLKNKLGIKPTKKTHKISGFLFLLISIILYFKYILSALWFANNEKSHGSTTDVINQNLKPFWVSINNLPQYQSQTGYSWTMAIFASILIFIAFIYFAKQFNNQNQLLYQLKFLVGLGLIILIGTTTIYGYNQSVAIGQGVITGHTLFTLMYIPMEIIKNPLYLLIGLVALNAILAPKFVSSEGPKMLKEQKLLKAKYDALNDIEISIEKRK